MASRSPRSSRGVTTPRLESPHSAARASLQAGGALQSQAANRRSARAEFAQQLVQRHAEAVDVGRCGDGAAQSTVRVRRTPGIDARCASRRRRVSALQKLGDSEIEQLHATFGGDAVYWRASDRGARPSAHARMPRLHTLAQNMLSRCCSVALCALAPEREVFPLDIFHDHVRPAVSSHSSVKQSGNAGMIELREDAAFGVEALD
jgi:hypothetical protein